MGFLFGAGANTKGLHASKWAKPDASKSVASEASQDKSTGRNAPTSKLCDIDFHDWAREFEFGYVLCKVCFHTPNYANGEYYRGLFVENCYGSDGKIEHQMVVGGDTWCCKVCGIEMSESHQIQVY